MTLLLFLLILSVLIFVHELGHFYMAKKNGILVEEFGFGLPPRIWGKKIGETIYSINLLPIGGFVKLYGEDAITENNEQKTMSSDLGRAFFTQRKTVRAVILLAGVVMNFVLGVVLFSVIYTRLGIPTESGEVSIVEIVPNSPAAEAGIRREEVVLAVDGQMIESTDQFVELVNASAGREIELSLGEADMEVYGRMVTVTPREDPPENEGSLGVVVSSVRMKFFPLWQMPLRGAWFGLKEAIGWGLTIVVALYVMIRDLLMAGVVPQDIAGPVGIFQLTGTVARAGILSLLQFVAILSVNLAVINILPFPALDGGRLLFLGIEAVTGKRVDGKLEQWMHGLGMVLLLFLLVLVTLNDIVRLTGTGNLRGLMEKVLPF